MNLYDLFIRRRAKVERLTKALAKAHNVMHFTLQAHRHEMSSVMMSSYNSAQPYIAEASKLKKEYKDLEDKYTALKAIVLSIDDERIKEV